MGVGLKVAVLRAAGVPRVSGPDVLPLELRFQVDLEAEIRRALSVLDLHTQCLRKRGRADHLQPTDQVLGRFVSVLRNQRSNEDLVVAGTIVTRLGLVDRLFFLKVPILRIQAVLFGVAFEESDEKPLILRQHHGADGIDRRLVVLLTAVVHRLRMPEIRIGVIVRLGRLDGVDDQEYFLPLQIRDDPIP